MKPPAIAFRRQQIHPTSRTLTCSVDLWQPPSAAAHTPCDQIFHGHSSLQVFESCSLVVAILGKNEEGIWEMVEASRLEPLRFCTRLPTDDALQSQKHQPASGESMMQLASAVFAAHKARCVHGAVCVHARNCAGHLMNMHLRCRLLASASG